MFNNNFIENLKIKFSIGRKKKESIGILNKGKNNKFLNSEFSGLDIGIKDEGENTEARGNKFKKIKILIKYLY